MAKRGQRPGSSLMYAIDTLAPTIIAFEMISISVSEMIMQGLQRRLMSAVNSRTMRRPNIDISRIVTKRLRVTSLTTLCPQNHRPQTIWSNCEVPSSSKNLTGRKLEIIQITIGYALYLPN